METDISLLSEEVIEVYVYHPETFEYINKLYLPKIVYEGIKDKNNLTNKQPKNIYDNYSTNVFNREKDDWEILEDYRDFCYNIKLEKIKSKFKGYYLPLEGDTPDSPRRFNSTFGPLPENAIITNLPSKDLIINNLKYRNEQKYIENISILLEDKDLEEACNSPITEKLIYAKVIETDDKEQYVNIIDKNFDNQLKVKKAIIDIKLNILTRARLGDESAKKVVENYYDKNDNKIYDVLPKIDKLTMCYEYYNCWLDIIENHNDNFGYTELYKEYNNKESPDYEKIKIELGI